MHPRYSLPATALPIFPRLGTGSECCLAQYQATNVLQFAASDIAQLYYLLPQPPLSTSATASYFKDCCHCLEMPSRYCPSIFTRALCPVDSVQSRPRLRSASTGSIQPPRVQTSIGQLYMGRQCGTVCQQPCVTTVYHRTPSRRS